MSKPKLYLNLYWHMHQPDYRDSITGEYALPWTYLHAIKDYTDMAWHLETNPSARVTFNFVPVLLDQLEDYASQFRQGKIRDPLLALLAEKDLANLSDEQCELIIHSCFKSHHEKMLAPFAHYQRLYNIFKTLESESVTPFNYLSAQYKADLLVWYHLAWTGESIRRENALVQSLMTKGFQFTLDDRLNLFELIGELIADLIPRYRRLQERGQIEISTTPHSHPILPLLLDFRTARDAMPYAPLPGHNMYPGGRQRAEAHVVQALESHAQRFGLKPAGMWPAEGGVSHEALSLLARYGVRWAATGEGVLANSLYKSYQTSELPPRPEYLYKPYRVTDGTHDIVCFFRDDLLSDKIGFEYAKLHSHDAIRDFIGALDHILASTPEGACRVVSVILDGENAWEYYPYNGYYFLSELYQALTAHPGIEMTTFSNILQKCETGEIQAESLPALAAGSWVYGSFSTWIGSGDKNLAWDLLCEAKQVYDRVVQSGQLSEDEQRACERQLAVCEGSDWFWWFGDYNSAVSVDSFDRLFRRNLANLYHLLKQPVPVVLNKPISVGSTSVDAGGAMRRGQEA
ncbi:MAG TPA: glycoside hydrolase family 57 protein [Methylophilaceae bacterium]